MAGRMGGDRITVKGLEVVEVRDDGMTIKGLVPGAKGGLLEIKSQYGKITN
jgi:ribosomal protein L3